MPSTHINIRTDSETKEKAQMILAELGLDMTTAINLFLRQTVRERAIPFNVYLGTPNAELREAMDDVRLNRNLHGPYDTAEEAVAAMLED